MLIIFKTNDAVRYIKECFRDIERFGDDCTMSCVRHIGEIKKGKTMIDVERSRYSDKIVLSIMSHDPYKITKRIS